MVASRVPIPPSLESLAAIYNRQAIRSFNVAFIVWVRSAGFLAEDEDRCDLIDWIFFFFFLLLFTVRLMIVYLGGRALEHGAGHGGGQNAIDRIPRVRFVA